MGDTAAGQMESYLVSNRNLDSVSEGGVGEDRQLNRIYGATGTEGGTLS